MICPGCCCFLKVTHSECPKCIFLDAAKGRDGDGKHMYFLLCLATYTYMAKEQSANTVRFQATAFHQIPLKEGQTSFGWRQGEKYTGGRKDKKRTKN